MWPGILTAKYTKYAKPKLPKAPRARRGKSGTTVPLARTGLTWRTSPPTKARQRLPLSRWCPDKSGQRRPLAWRPRRRRGKLRRIEKPVLQDLHKTVVAQKAVRDCKASGGSRPPKNAPGAGMAAGI